MHRRRFLAAVSTIPVGLGGCARIRGMLGEPAFDIGMRANAFDPPEFEVDVGGTVVWYNNDDRLHTVTAYDGGRPADAPYFASGGFDSESAARAGYNRSLDGALSNGERFEHTFRTPGTHAYFCVPHELGGMIGSIAVLE